MALDQQYRQMLRNLMLGSDALRGQQTLPDGSIIGYDANTPDDMIAAVANPQPPMPEIQQQQIEQPRTPQRISDLLVSQRPQDFGDQQRFDEAYQFKQQMPEGQSYLRNNTTGAVQTLPSGQRQTAAAPSNAFNDLIRFGQANGIDPATIGKLIKYQTSAQAGMPSAKDLYTASFKYNKPIDEMLGYYGAAAAGQSAQNAAQMQGEKDRLGLEKQRLELAQARGGGTSEYDKALQKGLAEAQVKGVLARTPGTPEFERIQKEEQGRKKETEKLSSTLKLADQLVTTGNKALGQVNALSAGLGGQLTGWIAGTPGKDLESTIRELKANIGFERLQKMRDESPTGGALGQVAVQELDMLQAVLGSLDTNQSPPQLQYNIGKVIDHYNRFRMAVGGQGQDQPQTATRQSQQQGKVMSMQDVFDTAKKTGKSMDEVIAAAKSKGYVIK